MDSKIEHLKMIQDIITRMGGNLFILKGWTITLIVALFTFTASNPQTVYVLFSFILLIIFWLLDGYFLSLERCYRDLYKSVRKKKVENIDFSMDYKKYMKGKNTWFRSIFSDTLIIFYGALLAVIISITLYMKIDKVKIELDVNCVEQNTCEIINQKIKE